MTGRDPDGASDPLVWYVYILELADGGYYIGQTNDLVTRIAEHAIGGGAKATQGKTPRLVWFSHTHDRVAAKRMENRLRRALQRSPASIAEAVANFDRLIRLVRPDKTLSQLQEEDRIYKIEMSRLMHVVPVTIGHRRAVCGWSGDAGGRLHGTDRESLMNDAEAYDAVERGAGEDAARRAVGREPCRRWLSFQEITGVWR